MALTIQLESRALLACSLGHGQLKVPTQIKKRILTNVRRGLFDCLGSLGSLGLSSVRDPFEAPSKLRETVFFYDIFENHFLLFCRANNSIIVKGWLNFGPLWGNPFAGLFFALF